MKKLVYLLTLALLAVSGTMRADDKSVYQNSYNYQKGIEALKQDDDKESALEYFTEEVKANPKNGYAFYWIAAICENEKKYGEGIEAANNAVKYLKKDKEWTSYTLRLRADIHLALDKTDEAQKDWAEAIRNDPKNTDNYGARANYYYRNDEYDKSDLDWDKIIKLEPNNSYGYGGKARNMLARGKSQEAADMFSYCIKLDPEYSQNYAFLGDCYIRLQKWPEAADNLVKALSINNNEKAFFLLDEFKSPQYQILVAKLKGQGIKDANNCLWPYYIGTVYENNHLYQKAIESYKASNKIQEDDVTLDRISSCYEELGNYSLAIEYKNRCIELDSLNDTYVQELADLKYEADDAVGAIADYGKFIEQRPDYFGGYYRRGFMKDNTNDVDGAIEDYTMAITLNPDFAYSYLGRGDKYKQKGLAEQAMADYRRVTELDTIPGTANCAHYAFLALGEKDKAIAFMDSILVKTPDDAGNYYDAACLYARMGDTNTALKYLRISFENGYRQFSHIEKDDDMDNLRNLTEYQNLVSEYKAKAQADCVAMQEKQEADDTDSDSVMEEHTTEIPFTRNSGGTLDVACTINDLPLHFCFDTGCSDVSISQVEANFMMKNGYLTQKDVVGTGRYSDAEGNVCVGTVLNLKNVKFGELTLTNVRASVVKNQRAPLLLGQTVLSRAGKVEIDNENKKLVVRYKK